MPRHTSVGPFVRGGAIAVLVASGLWFGAGIWREYQGGPRHEVAMSLLIAAIALAMVRQTISAVVWIGMVRTIGYRLGTMPGLAVYFLAGLGRYAPGKVAHVLGRVVLLGPWGIPARTVLITAALEAGLSIGVACGLATYVVTFFFPQLTGVAVAAIVAACVIFTVVLHPTVRGGASGLTALPGWLGSSIEEFARVRYRIALIWFAIHVGGWVLQMGAFWLTLASVGLQPFDLDLRIGAVIAASYLSGLAVPFAPAGIGVREVSITGLLGFWMPLEDALEATILYRLVTMGAELLTGFGGLAVWARLRPDAAIEGPAADANLAPVTAGPPTDG